MNACVNSPSVAVAGGGAATPAGAPGWVVALAAARRASTTGPALVVARSSVAHGSITSGDADATTVGRRAHVLRLPCWRDRYGGGMKMVRQGRLRRAGVKLRRSGKLNELLEAEPSKERRDTDGRVVSPASQLSQSSNVFVHTSGLQPADDDTRTRKGRRSTTSTVGGRARLKSAGRRNIDKARSPRRPRARGG